MEATEGWRRGNCMMAVTATVVAQVRFCGRGCVKTSATAVTTRWRSKLGLMVASETAMKAARQQK